MTDGAGGQAKLLGGIREILVSRSDGEYAESR
jgi:hypothetical protein